MINFEKGGGLYEFQINIQLAWCLQTLEGENCQCQFVNCVFIYMPTDTFLAENEKMNLDNFRDRFYNLLGKFEFQSRCKGKL